MTQIFDEERDRYCNGGKPLSFHSLLSNLASKPCISICSFSHFSYPALSFFCLYLDALSAEVLMMCVYSSNPSTVEFSIAQLCVVVEEETYGKARREEVHTPSEYPLRGSPGEFNLSSLSLSYPLVQRINPWNVICINNWTPFGFFFF